MSGSLTTRTTVRGRLPEVLHNLAGHVTGNDPRHKPGDRSRRLRHHEHRIDDGVHDATNGSRLVQVDGALRARIGQHVHKADNDQRQDVLQIVAVGSTRWTNQNDNLGCSDLSHFQ